MGGRFAIDDDDVRVDTCGNTQCSFENCLTCLFQCEITFATDSPLNQDERSDGCLVVVVWLSEQSLLFVSFFRGLVVLGLARLGVVVLFASVGCWILLHNAPTQAT